MKYAKVFGLLALAVAASMAVVGTASATELTSPAGTKLGVGSKVKFESEGSVSITGSVTVTCEESGGEGQVGNAGGSGETVAISFSSSWTKKCGNHTVTHTVNGSYIVHEVNWWFDEVTTVSFETTLLMHSFLLGTVHCIYIGSGMKFGSLTDSSATGGTATIDIESAPLSRVATSPACGPETYFEGSYRITTPDSLYVD